MSYNLINEALQDIESLRVGHKKFKKVSNSLVDNLRGDDRQGEFNEIIEIYSLGVDDLHIKLTLRTNSYGYDESIHSVQVVKPIVKQVTDFEPIK
jgi:hypothetical protein